MSEQQRSINGTLTASSPVVGSLNYGGTVNGWVGIPPRYDNIRTFDTVADMAAARDLSAAAVCHTLGFHAVGDGGAAFYRMSATGTANGMDIIECDGSGLYANLVITEPYVTPEQFGAYGDGVHDDASVIQYIAASSREVRGGGKSYAIATGIYLSDVNVIMQDCIFATSAIHTFTFVDCDGIVFINCHFYINNSNGYLENSQALNMTRYENAIIRNCSFKGFHIAVLQTAANNLTDDYMSGQLCVENCSFSNTRCAVHIADLENAFINELTYNGFFDTGSLPAVFYIRANVKKCIIANCEINDCTGSIFHFNRIGTVPSPQFDASDPRTSKVIASNIHGTNIGRVVDTNSVAEFYLFDSAIFGTNDKNRGIIEPQNGNCEIVMQNCVFDDFVYGILNTVDYHSQITNPYRNIKIANSTLNVSTGINSRYKASINIENNDIYWDNIFALMVNDNAANANTITEMNNVFYDTAGNKPINQTAKEGNTFNYLFNTHFSVGRNNCVVLLTSTSANNTARLIGNIDVLANMVNNQGSNTLVNQGNMPVN